MSWLRSQIPHRIQFDDMELRRYEMTDAYSLCEAVASSLSELMPWMPWAQWEPQSLEQRAELIETWQLQWAAGREFVMGIFQRGELVGSSGFHSRGDAGQLEIGYWVRSDCVGTGIATRSSRALVDVAFRLPEVREVQILHDKANVKSQRVPEKLGFDLLREEPRDPQSPGDIGIACIWSMSRQKWEMR